MFYERIIEEEVEQVVEKKIPIQTIREVRKENYIEKPVYKDRIIERTIPKRVE